MRTTIRHMFILVSIVVVLASCETAVKFKGEVSEPKIVLHSDIYADEPIRVYVGHSYFFLDRNIADIYGGYIHEQDGTPTKVQATRGVLADAKVEYRVNEGEWQAMTYYTDTTMLYHGSIGMYRTEYMPKAGEQIEVRASHKDYPEASFLQIVPQKPKAEIVEVLYNEKRPNQMSVKVYVEKYEGSATDYLVFGMRGMLTYYDENYQPLYTRTSWYYSSTDPIFGEARNPSYMSVEFYPYKNGYLFMPASAVKESGREIVFDFNISDRRNYINGSYGGGSQPKAEYYRRGNEVIIGAWTEDSYQYVISMATYNGELREEYSMGYEEDFDSDMDFDITEELEYVMEDLNGEFGVEAGVQVYNNVEGGYGHASASAYTTILRVYNEFLPLNP